MMEASFWFGCSALNVCALSKCEMNVSRKYLARKINFEKSFASEVVTGWMCCVRAVAAGFSVGKIL